MDELLDREIFPSLKEAQTAIEGRRRHYNAARRACPSAIGRRYLKALSQRD
jgi:hypothetical protein